MAELPRGPVFLGSFLNHVRDAQHKMSNVHKTLDEIIASVDQVFKKQELIDKMEDGTLSLEEVRALQSILIQRKHMFDNLLTILNTLVPPREG